MNFIHNVQTGFGVYSNVCGGGATWSGWLILSCTLVTRAVACARRARPLFRVRPECKNQLVVEEKNRSQFTVSPSRCGREKKSICYGCQVAGLLTLHLKGNIIWSFFLRVEVNSECRPLNALRGVPMKR